MRADDFPVQRISARSRARWHQRSYADLLQGIREGHRHRQLIPAEAYRAYDALVTHALLGAGMSLDAELNEPHARSIEVTRRDQAVAFNWSCSCGAARSGYARKADCERGHATHVRRFVEGLPEGRGPAKVAA